MTGEELLSLAAYSAGFAAGIFFCVGIIFTKASDISMLSATRLDSNVPWSHALAAQRAQYAAGGLLLVISFLLQVLAVGAASTSYISLPQWLETKLRIVLIATVLFLLIGCAVEYVLYMTTKEKLQQEERTQALQ